MAPSNSLAEECPANALGCCKASPSASGYFYSCYYPNAGWDVAEQMANCTSKGGTSE